MKDNLLKRFLCLAAVLMLVLSLAACGSDKDAGTGEEEEVELTMAQRIAAGEKINVAVSMPQADSAWMSDLTKRMQNYLDASESINSVVKISPDVDDQIEILTAYGADKAYDMILVVPVDGLAITETVEAIYDSGVPIFLAARDIKSEKRTAYIGEDHYGCGVCAATYAENAFAGKNAVSYVVLHSNEGSESDTQRYAGLTERFAVNPAFTLLGEADGKGNSADGYTAMQSLLDAYNKIDYVYAADDDVAEGAMAAVVQAGRSDVQLITGVGGTVISMNEILANDCIHRMSASDLPADLANVTVRTLLEYATAGSCNTNLAAASHEITPETVNELLGYAYE